MKALVLSSSPRRNGNSALLAEAVSEGLAEAGHEAEFVFADDFLHGFLRDCRKCRKPDGECSIEDGFRSVFLDRYLPADGFIAATPIYWYGSSAQLKAFFDRTFCYYAASYPESARVMEQMSRKRIGLVLASEETYPGASLGIVHQIQEYSRYTHSEFVGVVRGIGNSRSEVTRDPGDPLIAAERLGRDMFDLRYSDYRLDSPRSGKVWTVENPPQ